MAENLRIEPTVIEKDHVLSHFLNALYTSEDIRKNFIFKGGTCLKKCYFEDYRFSEDLDFTLLDEKFVIDKSFIQQIIAIATQNSGAKFHLKEIKPQFHNDIAQGYEITIQFWGANHKPNQRPLPPERWQTKIKIDISFSEKVILEPVLKGIFHSYSDKETINSKVPVYAINEIIAEKLRALVQRNRPRDIYDLYYLSALVHDGEYTEIFDLLIQKSTHKSVIWEGSEDFVNERKFNQNKRAWISSLNHHLPEGELIDFEVAYEQVTLLVKHILRI